RFVQCIQHSLRGDQLRQKHRLRLLGSTWIYEVHRHPGSAVLLQDLRYFRVAFRPISLQGNHISLQKFLSYLRRIDGEALVGFAGDTPIGGEVDEDRLAGCERLVERRFAEGPPNQLTRLSDESI